MADYNSQYNGSQVDAAIAKVMRSNGFVEITYAELKTLRDAGNLNPGTLYRITDYVTKVFFEDEYNATAVSAEHPFDVIVLAIDSSRLSEEAWAAHHAGDTYFANSNLDAWKLWYKLDGSKEYKWSDAKGIIVDYDDCICLRTKILDGENGFAWTHDYEPGSTSSKLFYTETENPSVGDTFTDEWGTEHTIIGLHEDSGKGIIYRMIDEFGNDCPYDFKNIMFYRRWDSTYQLWSEEAYPYSEDAVLCYTFSSAGDSTTTVFTDASLNANGTVQNNVIKQYCGDAKTIKKLNNICFFDDYVYNNTFDDDCYYCTFGSCEYSVFGNSCHDIIFGDSYRNTVGTDCSYIHTKNYCQRNIFGSFCSNIEAGRGFRNNVFLGHNGSISFGDYCESNFFGKGAGSISFTTTKTGSTLSKNFKKNTFDPDARDITIWAAASGDDYVQFYHFKASVGASGTSDSKKIAAVRGRLYETTVARDSQGNVKQYCEADLAQ